MSIFLNALFGRKSSSTSKSSPDRKTYHYEALGPLHGVRAPSFAGQPLSKPAIAKPYSTYTFPKPQPITDTRTKPNVLPPEYIEQANRLYAQRNVRTDQGRSAQDIYFPHRYLRQNDPNFFVSVHPGKDKKMEQKGLTPAAPPPPASPAPPPAKFTYPQYQITESPQRISLPEFKRPPFVPKSKQKQQTPPPSPIDLDKEPVPSPLDLPRFDAPPGFTPAQPAETPISTKKDSRATQTSPRNRRDEAAQTEFLIEAEIKPAQNKPKGKTLAKLEAYLEKMEDSAERGTQRRKSAPEAEVDRQRLVKLKAEMYTRRAKRAMSESKHVDHKPVFELIETLLAQLHQRDSQSKQHEPEPKSRMPISLKGVVTAAPAPPSPTPLTRYRQDSSPKTSQMSPHLVPAVITQPLKAAPLSAAEISQIPTPQLPPTDEAPSPQIFLTGSIAKPPASKKAPEPLKKPDIPTAAGDLKAPETDKTQDSPRNVQPLKTPSPIKMPQPAKEEASEMPEPTNAPEPVKLAETGKAAAKPVPSFKESPSTQGVSTKIQSETPAEQIAQTVTDVQQTPSPAKETTINISEPPTLTAVPTTIPKKAAVVKLAGQSTAKKLDATSKDLPIQAKIGPTELEGTLTKSAGKAEVSKSQPTKAGVDSRETKAQGEVPPPSIKKEAVVSETDAAKKLESSDKSLVKVLPEREPPQKSGSGVEPADTQKKPGVSLVKGREESKAEFTAPIPKPAIKVLPKAADAREAAKMPSPKPSLQSKETLSPASTQKKMPSPPLTQKETPSPLISKPAQESPSPVTAKLPPPLKPLVKPPVKAGTEASGETMAAVGSKILPKTLEKTTVSKSVTPALSKESIPQAGSPEIAVSQKSVNVAEPKLPASKMVPAKPVGAKQVEIESKTETKVEEKETEGVKKGGLKLGGVVIPPLALHKLRRALSGKLGSAEDMVRKAVVAETSKVEPVSSGISGKKAPTEIVPESAKLVLAGAKIVNSPKGELSALSKPDMPLIKTVNVPKAAVGGEPRDLNAISKKPIAVKTSPPIDRPAAAGSALEASALTPVAPKEASPAPVPYANKESSSLSSEKMAVVHQVRLPVLKTPTRHKAIPNFSNNSALPKPANEVSKPANPSVRLSAFRFQSRNSVSQQSFI